MNIEILQNNKTSIAEVTSNKVIINNAQDALDIFANCQYQGASNIIVHKQNIIPGLFDLKTGIAGEVFQKCSNYRIRMAIVGDFSNIPSKSLRDFIYESNKQGLVNFAGTKQEAIARLS